jgi:alpha-glucosidase
VNIHDVGKSQFVIPRNIVGSPPRAPETIADVSDLLFNYEPSPFSFWITRRSDPHLFPLFDTRMSSLPKTPTSAAIQGASSTALDAFPLVFEDRYLQVLAIHSPHLEVPEAFCSLPPRSHLMPMSMVWVRLLPAVGLDEISEEVLEMDPFKPCGTETAPTRLMKTCMRFPFPSAYSFAPEVSFRYGSHPVYLEHRFSDDTIMPLSHGVYLHR